LTGQVLDLQFTGERVLQLYEKHIQHGIWENIGYEFTLI